MDKRDDPDETEGCRLYRAQADALARSQESLAKRGVKIKDHGRPVPHHGSGGGSIPRRLPSVIKADYDGQD